MEGEWRGCGMHGRRATLLPCPCACACCPHPQGGAPPTSPPPRLLLRSAAPLSRTCLPLQELSAKVTKPIIVVLIHGGGIDISDMVISPKVAAVMTAWYPAQGARGVADVLTGAVPPSGEAACTPQHAACHMHHAAGAAKMQHAACHAICKPGLPRGRPLAGTIFSSRCDCSF